MTEWWAFKPVTTAFEKTKKLLLEPFNIWTWLKLMIIVFFVGTAGGRLGNNFGNSANYQAGPSDSAAIEQGINSVLSNTTLVAIIIGLVLLVICIVLLLSYLRNVFSFVLIRALASGDVEIIKPFMDNLGRGLRLFAFTLLLGLVTLAVVVLFILVMVFFVFMIIQAGTASALGIILLVVGILLILLFIMVMVLFSTAMSIVIGFTYDFVAPMMLFKNMGILEAWRVLWASIKKDWQQYGVYVLTRWALEFVVGILSLIVLLPVALLFIAVLLLGGITAAATAGVSIMLAIAMVMVLLVVLAVFLLVMMAISMPIAVYFRYYSLDVLKQIDPSAVLYSDRFAPPPATLPA